MMRFRGIYILIVFVILFSIGFLVHAQTVNINVSKLIRRVVEASLSPNSGSFTEGSTFEVPIIVNTKGFSVNSVEIRVNYDKDKLTIVSSSNGVSIIGVWIEPPKYDNTRGTASYVGGIPGGITADSGIIGTITFKAVRTGRAVVSISPSSKILLNDGLGTEASVDLRRAEYNIVPKAPEGVKIFSDTHPFQDEWYNNNSPVISWERDSGVKGFSYVFDNKPSTVPDNAINATGTLQSFQNLGDGLWYFHIKASKDGVWGTTGDFLVRIDTTPPADFKPEANYMLASTALIERALISFFTTDNLSGINHYEIGIINKKDPPTQSPIFVQSESPFQVPLDQANLRVIVRAVDNAGNVRDASIDIKAPLLITKLVKDYLVYILIFIAFAGLAIVYRVIRNLKRTRKFESSFIKPGPL